MRIDALSKVSQLYTNTNIKKTAKTSSGSNTDKLEISQLGREYQVVKQAVKSVSDVREDKVAAIKKSMADGTYNVSDESFAEAILAKYFG